jgi:hypothetical protein
MIRVIYTENGVNREMNFEDESEAKTFKAELKAKGIKGKWEW